MPKAALRITAGLMAGCLILDPAYAPLRTQGIGLRNPHMISAFCVLSSELFVEQALAQPFVDQGPTIPHPAIGELASAASMDLHPTPASTASNVPEERHNPPVIETFDSAPGAQFALVVHPEGFEPDGRFRRFWNRIKNRFWRDHREIPAVPFPGFDEYKIRVAELVRQYQESHPDMDVLAVLPNGNLGYNRWFMGATGDVVFHNPADRFPQKDWDMLVELSGGRRQVMTLRTARDPDGRLRLEDPSTQEDMTSKIVCALYGPRLLHKGEIDWESIANHTDDLRHALRLPFWSTKGRFGGQLYLGFADGKGELYRDRDRVLKALKGEPVTYSLDPLIQNNISPEERDRVLADWGYQKLDPAIGATGLPERGYFISGNQITIRLSHGVSAHTVFGITEDGRPVVGAVPGLTNHQGATLPELALAMKAKGATEVYLWANGKDAYADVKGKETVAAANAKSVALEALLVVRPKQMGGIDQNDAIIQQALDLALDPVEDGYRSTDEIRDLARSGRLTLAVPEPGEAPPTLIPGKDIPSAYLNYPLIARLMQLRQDIDAGRLTTLARYKVDLAIRLLVRHELQRAREKMAGRPAWQNPAEVHEISALLSEAGILAIPPTPYETIRDISSLERAYQAVWRATTQMVESGGVPRPLKDREGYTIGLIAPERIFPADFRETLENLDQELLNLDPEFRDKLEGSFPEGKHTSLMLPIADWLGSAFDFSLLTEDQLQKIQKVLNRHGPLQIRFTGLNMGPDGTIFAEGHPVDEELFALRDELGDLFPDPYRRTSMVHIALERITGDLTPAQFGAIYRWVERYRPENRSSPLGEIVVQTPALRCATSRFGTKDSPDNDRFLRMGERRPIIPKDETRKFLEENHILAGLHQITGGRGYTGTDEPTLRKFVEILIERWLTPCLDNLAVLRALRLNPALDHAPIGFFVGGDLSRAEQAARGGANILIGTLSREQIEPLRLRYPHLVFMAEVTDKASLDRALASVADGIQIKPWAKAVAALEQDGITLAALRREHPELLIAGAGGIFDTNVGQVLDLPEHILPAVGFNAQDPESFLAQARRYKPDVPGIRSRSAGTMYWLKDVLFGEQISDETYRRCVAWFPEFLAAAIVGVPAALALVPLFTGHRADFAAIAIGIGVAFVGEHLIDWIHKMNAQQRGRIYPRTWRQLIANFGWAIVVAVPPTGAAVFLHWPVLVLAPVVGLLWLGWHAALNNRDYLLRRQRNSVPTAVPEREAHPFGAQSPESAMPVLLVQNLHEELKGTVPVVLEAGSAEGSIAQWLKDQGCHVLAIDKNREMIRSAREQHEILPAQNDLRKAVELLRQSERPAVAYEQADLEQGLSSLPDGSVDAVVLHRTLSMIADVQARERLAREIVRVLRPGGLFSYLDYRKKMPGDFTSSKRARIFALRQAILRHLEHAGRLASTTIPFLSDPSYELRLWLRTAEGDLPEYDSYTEEELLRAFDTGKIWVKAVMVHAEVSRIQRMFEEAGLEDFQRQEVEVLRRFVEGTTRLVGFMARRPSALNQRQVLPGRDHGREGSA